MPRAIPLEMWFFFVATAPVVLLFIYFALVVYPRRELSEETRKRPRSFISNAIFREYWYFMMEPLKRKFIDWDVSPNTLTLWGCIFSVAAGYFFALGNFGMGGWMVVLAATCDVYDGMLARARNISLKSGAFFDSTLDRVGETAMFVGLLWFFRYSPSWFFIIFIGQAAAQLVSYCRARAEGLGFGGARGFFQRAERMIVLSIGMGVAPLVDYFSPGLGPKVAEFTVLAVCAGSLQTAITRSFSIYFEIRRSEKNKPISAAKSSDGVSAKRSPDLHP